MRLHPNWWAILTTAWSARLALLSAVLSAAEGAVSYYVDGSFAKALTSFLLSAGIGFSRIIVQKDLHPDE